MTFDDFLPPASLESAEHTEAASPQKTVFYFCGEAASVCSALSSEAGGK